MQDVRHCSFYYGGLQGSRTYGRVPTVELMLVVFALFAIATPFATFYLLWRERILRQQLLKLTNLSMEISDGLRRDLLELKRQVETSAAPAPPAEAPSHVRPPVHAQTDKTTSPVVPPAQLPLASPVRVAPPIPVVEKAPATIPASAKKDTPPVGPRPDQAPPPVPAILQKAEPKTEPRTEPKTEQKPAPAPTVPPPIAAASPAPPAAIVGTPVL